MSGFVRDIERLAETLGVKQQADEQRSYKWVDNLQDIQEMIYSVHESDVISLDTEYDKDGLYCYSLSNEEGTGWCVLVGHTDDKWRYEALKHLELIVWTAGRVVFHNAKADIPVLQAAGVRVPWEKVQDTIVQAYVLRKAPLGLKDLASNELGLKVIRLEELRDPDVRLADMDQARLAHYSAQDADLTLRLYHKFKKELAEA
jgi:DNA polymerase I-like protein with 3'-5' exonuclease and polymerase domains